MPMRMSYQDALIPPWPLVNVRYGLRIKDTGTKLEIEHFGVYKDARSYGIIQGPTDQLAKFQQACDEIEAAGGGTLYIPGGTYRLSGTLRAPNVRLLGESVMTTVLLWTVQLGTDLNNVAFGIDQQPDPNSPPDFAMIENMVLQGPQGTAPLGQVGGYMVAVRLAKQSVIYDVAGGGWFAGYASYYGEELIWNCRVGGNYGLYYGPTDNPGGLQVINSELSGGSMGNIVVHWNGVIRNLVLQGVHLGVTIYCIHKWADPLGGPNGRSFIEGLLGVDVGAEAFSAALIRAELQEGADVEDVIWWTSGCVNPMQTNYGRGTPPLPMDAPVRAGIVRRWRTVGDDLAWFAGSNIPPIETVWKVLGMEDCRFETGTAGIRRSGETGLPFGLCSGTVKGNTIRDLWSECQLFKAAGVIAPNEVVGLVPGGSTNVRTAQSGDIIVGVAQTPTTGSNQIVSVIVWGNANTLAPVGVTIAQRNWLVLDPANPGKVISSASYQPNATIGMSQQAQNGQVVSARLSGLLRTTHTHVQ